MNAAELRALAEVLNYQTWSEWRTEDESKFAQAAEILELLAWAEESGFKVERGERYWWTRGKDSKPMAERTLVRLLRRAREASK